MVRCEACHQKARVWYYRWHHKKFGQLPVVLRLCDGCAQAYEIETRPGPGWQFFGFRTRREAEAWPEQWRSIMDRFGRWLTI